MKRVVLLVVCWSSLTSAAVAQTPASGSSQTFHALRLGDQPPATATLGAAAWLAGRWIGEGLGGVSEEIWSEPRGGVMMGMYRSLKQEQPIFYEFLMLAEEKGSLVLKLKHFNPDFSAWEEKSGFVSFRLVKVEDRAIHFDGLSFIRESDDAMLIYLLLRDKSGTVREEEFRMRRVTNNRS